MKHKWLKITVGILGFIIISIGLFVYGNYRNSTYIKTISLPAQEHHHEINSIRIGTYNIKSLNMGKGLDAFEEEINALSMDIIALQEVDANAYRSGNMDMVTEMAEAVGFTYAYFYPSMWIIDGFYGLGILSRYPIEEVSSVQLPNVLWQEPRILAHATVNVDGQILNIYNTHLTYNDHNVRNNQIAYITDHLQHVEKTILMGDFNTFRDNTDFSIPGMRQINTAEQSYLTFRNIASPDNIYYSEDLHADQIKVQSSEFSDHNLLYCDISW